MKKKYRDIMYKRDKNKIEKSLKVVDPNVSMDVQEALKKKFDGNKLDAKEQKDYEKGMEILNKIDGMKSTLSETFKKDKENDALMKKTGGDYKKAFKYFSTACCE